MLIQGRANSGFICFITSSKNSTISRFFDRVSACFFGMLCFLISFDNLF